MDNLVATTNVVVVCKCVCVPVYMNPHCSCILVSPYASSFSSSPHRSWSCFEARGSQSRVKVFSIGSSYRLTVVCASNHDRPCAHISLVCQCVVRCHPFLLLFLLSLPCVLFARACGTLDILDRNLLNTPSIGDDRLHRSYTSWSIL